MAGATSFNLRVVTPEGLVCDEEVTSVLLPSTVGPIGILPQHVGYAGLMGIGILEYLPVEKPEATKVIVSGGFCNFLDDGLVVLAGRVDRPEDVNRDALLAEKEELAKLLREGSAYEASWAENRAKLDRIEAIEKAGG